MMEKEREVGIAGWEVMSTEGPKTDYRRGSGLGAQAVGTGKLK